MTRNIGRLATSAAIAALIALSGCGKGKDGDGNAQVAFALPDLPATLPLANSPESEVVCAPAASDLPDAPPLRAARIADPGQAYGYADAAYSYGEALGDAPPDYAFDYEGVDPWAWQGYDDSLMFAEPIDDGYRYYYYRPGASEPYFIRDPYYSYGFAGGLIAAIYAADGGLVRYADYGPRLGYASRYYVRGQGLYRAARGGGRRPVIAANWQRRSPLIFAARSRWGAGRAHQPGWASYHQANLPRQAAYWREERVRRTADARRFDGWRAADFRGTPPPRAIPARWAEAKWAKNDRRFRPAAEARDDRKASRDLAGNPAERRSERQEARDDRPDRAAIEQRARQRAEGEQRQGEAVQPRRERVQQQQAERRQAQQQQSERQVQRDQAQRQRAERQDGQRQQAETRKAQREAARQRTAQARPQARPQAAQRPDRGQGARLEQQQRQQQRDTVRAQQQAERQAQQQQQRERGEQRARQQQQQAERGRQQAARQEQQRAARQPSPEAQAPARDQSSAAREQRREERREQRQRER